MNAPETRVASVQLALLLFMVGAAVATVWRPWAVGFLTDDWSVLTEPTLWSAPFSEARWQSLEIAQNRPVLRLILFVLTSIVPPRPDVWHAVGAMLNVAAGAAVAVFVHDILMSAGARVRDAQWSGAFAGICWIAFPWSAATQFWATGTTAMPAIICFATSVSLLVRHWQGSVAAIICGAALSFVSYLTYEAFYFQIFLVIAYLGWTRGFARTSSWIASAAYLAAQFFAVAFNHIMRLQGAEGARRVNANFIDVYFHWYLYAVRAVGLSAIAGLALITATIVALAFTLYAARRWFGTHTWPLAFITAIAIVCSGAILLTLPLSFPETFVLSLVGAILAAYALLSQPHVSTPGFGAVLLLALAGIALGALPFALGNYVIFSAGFGARTTFASAVWMALALGLLANLVSCAPRRRLAIVGLALIWLGLFVGDALRAREWGRAADVLQTIFQSPPAFPFGAVKKDAAFVLVGPEQAGWVPVIEVNHHVPALARIVFLPQAKTPDQIALLRGWDGRWVVARTQVWFTRWDGKWLTQSVCKSGEEFEKLAASELWIWDTGKRTITKSDSPISIGCAIPKQL